MPQSNLTILIRFLGSMNLAITLLVAIAIAAVIGTVVQQNLPYADYVLKFGPFWFEVFKSLGLFNVYSAGWFLTILAFLVISTTVCVYRNLPRMLRDMQDYREKSHRQSLQRLQHHQLLNNSKTKQQNIRFIEALLKHHHYKFKLKNDHDSILFAAKKGAGSRLGYIFSHVAIIIICIGGLIDGNVPLKIAEMLGNIVVETRRIPASQVPDISTLGEENLSFRANVDISEGQMTNLAFIDYKDGYLVQLLPFIIKVEDFRIEHYESGQPKSFESDLVIIDKDLKEPLRQTIAVNHPLSYKGYSVYQNSFGDGGSILRLQAWPLKAQQAAEELQATVKEPITIDTVAGRQTLEISDFRPFNVNPDPLGVKKFVNFGPSFQFKLRNETGVAHEYLNYMQPVEQNGALYYLSGSRSKPSEPFQYWFIPADHERRTDRFMNFYQILIDSNKLRKIAEQTARSSQNSRQLPSRNQQAASEFMLKITEQFVEGGYQKITRHIETTIAAEKRQEVSMLYASVLQQLLKNVYRLVLTEEGIDAGQAISAFDRRFFEDAVNAVNSAHYYGSPVWLDLQSFQHIEATGLQITRSPGKLLVFPGCLLLVLGVFFMFYMPQRRLWLIVEPEDILLAGSALRNRYDFDKEFELIKQQLSQNS